MISSRSELSTYFSSPISTDHPLEVIFYQLLIFLDTIKIRYNRGRLIDMTQLGIERVCGIIRKTSHFDDCVERYSLNCLYFSVVIDLNVCILRDGSPIA